MAPILLGLDRGSTQSPEIQIGSGDAAALAAPLTAIPWEQSWMAEPPFALSMIHAIIVPSVQAGGERERMT
jgi:hypothetical protein